MWVGKQQAVGILEKMERFQPDKWRLESGRDGEGGGSSGELGGWLFALSICVHGGVLKLINISAGPES